MSPSSPAPASAADSASRQKTAQEAYARLKKAVSTATDMADGVQLDALCEEAHRSLTAFLESHGPLSIHFDGSAAQFDGVRLDADTAGIGAPIAQQGVQRLSIQRGLTSDDTRRLVQAWADALADFEQSPQSILTRVWESSIDSVDGTVRDSPPEAQVQRALQRIMAAPPVPDPARLRALARSDLRQQVEFVAGLNRRNSASLEPRLERRYLEILGAEAESLRQFVLAADPEAASRAGACFVSIADLGTRAEFQALTGILKNAVQDLLEQEALGEAARLVETVRQAMLDDRNAGPKGELLDSVVQAIEGEEILNKLVDSLESPDRAPSAKTLLGTLQRTAVGGLFARLGRMKTATGRRQLSEAIKGRVPAVEALKGAIRDGDVITLKEILFIAEERGEEVRKALRIAGLEHGDPDVMLTILEGLPETATAEVARWLYPLVPHSHRGLRKIARERLVAIKDAGAVAGLVATLDEPTADKGEIRAVVNALGAIGGPNAAEALRQRCEEAKDNDLKVAMITAMGTTADPGALAYVEGLAKKLFVWPAVKTAAKDAHRRIEQSLKRVKDDEDRKARTAAALRDEEGTMFEDEPTLPRSKAQEPPKADTPTPKPAPMVVEPKSDAGFRRFKERDDPSGAIRKKRKLEAEAARKETPSRAPSTGRSLDGTKAKQPRETPRGPDSRSPDSRATPAPTRDSPSRAAAATEARPRSESRSSESRGSESRSETRSSETRTLPPRPATPRAGDPARTPQPATPKPKEATQPRTLPPRKPPPVVTKRPPPRTDLPKVAGMPDFDLMFKNYVHFEKGGEHVFARLYVDKLLDVHRYPAGAIDEAYYAFFQSKIKEGFLPQATSNAMLNGDEPLAELDWNILAVIYAKVMGKG